MRGFITIESAREALPHLSRLIGKHGTSIDDAKTGFIEFSRLWKIARNKMEREEEKMKG